MWWLLFEEFIALQPSVCVHSIHVIPNFEYNKHNTTAKLILITHTVYIIWFHTIQLELMFNYRTAFTVNFVRNWFRWIMQMIQNNCETDTVKPPSNLSSKVWTRKGGGGAGIIMYIHNLDEGVFLMNRFLSSRCSNTKHRLKIQATRTMFSILAVHRLYCIAHVHSLWYFVYVRNKCMHNIQTCVLSIVNNEWNEVNR